MLSGAGSTSASTLPSPIRAPPTRGSAMRGLARSLRDLAIIDFLDEIAEHQDWVYRDNLLVMDDGCWVSPFYLRAEAASLQHRAVFEPDAAKVSVENGTLSIHAERREEQRADAKGRYHLRERASGTIAHAFRLADDLNVEAITAECRNGLLTVRIPKRAETKPRQIEIKSN